MDSKSVYSNKTSLKKNESGGGGFKLPHIVKPDDAASIYLKSILQDYSSDEEMAEVETPQNHEEESNKTINIELKPKAIGGSR